MQVCYNGCMTKESKLIRIGNSVGMIVPRDVMAKLRVELGDKLYWAEQPDGFAVKAVNPDFIAAMAAAEDIMREDRDILAVLAK